MNKIKHIFITLLLLCIGVVKGYAYSFRYNGIYYNILSTTDKTLEVTYSELNYNSYSGDIVIPQFVNYNNDTYRVVRISDYAFQTDNITSIVLPEGLKSIGNKAFYSCENLTSIELPNGLESIGDYAFAECNNILEIKIGSKKAITASENIFSSDAYNNACLYVPTGRKDFYAKTSPWSNFIIREMDFTGIEELKSEPTVDASQR